jgi:hypothetical protein
MSQHSQRTQQGPSLASIVVTGAVVIAAVVASTLTVWMPESPDWWHVLGAAGWTVLAWVLTAQAVARYLDRRTAIDRAERAAQRRRAERALNTGTWEGETPGEVLTIRYEPSTGAYWAEGWISDHWQIRPETIWADRATLVHTLRELERSGEMTPWEDEGTRAVRARLDVDPEFLSVAELEELEDPGMAWDVPEDRAAEDEVNTIWEEAAEATRRAEALSAEDTRVIRYTDQGLPRRPVGETLRPIDVAQFRD